MGGRERQGLEREGRGRRLWPNTEGPGVSTPEPAHGHPSPKSVRPGSRGDLSPYQAQARRSSQQYQLPGHTHTGTARPWGTSRPGQWAPSRPFHRPGNGTLPKSQSRLGWGGDRGSQASALSGPSSASYTHSVALKTCFSDPPPHPSPRRGVRGAGCGARGLLCRDRADGSNQTPGRSWDIDRFWREGGGVWAPGQARPRPGASLPGPCRQQHREAICLSTCLSATSTQSPQGPGAALPGASLRQTQC